VQLAALQSVVSAEVPGVLVARSHLDLAVSSGPTWSSFDTGHRFRQKADHPLMSFASTSERYLLVTGLQRANAAEHASSGFASSSRHQRSESTWPVVYRATYVPPSPFLTTSTVCSSDHLVGLFRPTAT
jgi:hypothetical protein